MWVVQAGAHTAYQKLQTAVTAVAALAVFSSSSYQFLLSLKLIGC